MTVTDNFRCDLCGPVAVEVQVPAGSTCIDVGMSLAAITFESQVTHDISVHLDEVTA